MLTCTICGKNYKECSCPTNPYNQTETIKNQEWIPVSERLPKTDRYGDINVLVCMNDGFIWTATYDENNGWELWEDSGEVTHWMPLPDAPKKE